MMNTLHVLLEKLKEVFYAVLPITLIVIILHFTLSPLDPIVLYRFLIGAGFIIIGLAVFLFGVDIGITPIGSKMGAAIVKSNKIWIVLIAGITLGFFISIAEPDLHILAGQIELVTSGDISKVGIVIIVSIGIAVLLSVGLARIVYNIPLYKLLTVLYFIIFGLALFTSPEFLAISFDSSGATTGALTVPFMLALALGVSSLKKDSMASEKDSFGLVAVVSAGAIIAVMIMSIVTRQDKVSGSLGHHESSAGTLMGPFFHKLPIIAGEITMALLPILIIFIIFNKISFKLSKFAFRKMLIGVLFTFCGLVLFLVGVNAGFMDAGSLVGFKLAALDNKAYIIIVALLIGLVVVIAEPAVYVLTQQVEDVTSGYVSRKALLLTLSIGVGAAVALSMVRIIVPEVELWHYLLPGYLISIGLMYIVPKLFVGMAFDAGGVASGPMTATFILAFAQGAAESIDGADVLVDGFGIIAMVAMTPIIALQTLGLIFKIKSKKGGLEQK
jgi:hypothetical protein